jgi:hypothetical protein
MVQMIEALFLTNGASLFERENSFTFHNNCSSKEPANQNYPSLWQNQLCTLQYKVPPRNTAPQSSLGHLVMLSAKRCLMVPLSFP